MKELDRCFAPKSLALVGASRKPGTIGYALLKNILTGGYKGKLYPINPATAELQGVRTYPSLGAIEGDIDLVIIAVPAAAVKEVIQESIKKRAAGAVVISAGFSEIGAEGRQLQDEVLQIARANNLRIIGPNCLGIINSHPDVSLHATFSPHHSQPGNIAFLSQSGAVGVAVLDFAAPLHVGLSSFVSVGNKADVSSNDMLDYWSRDDSTAVIALYLESFGNPRKFTQIAKELAPRKPIVAVKSGRSQAGQRAASSHSAALADRDTAISALFEQLGVVRVDRLEELFDLVKLFSAGAIPQGNRIGVITNAGGPGIMLADACESVGLKLPQLSEDSIARLKSILSANASFGNPVDVIASGSPKQFAAAIEIIGADPQIDAIVVVVVPTAVTDTAGIALAIAESGGRVSKDKPILAVFLATLDAPASLHEGPRGVIPCYRFPENAATALAAAAQYNRWRHRPKSEVCTLSEEAIRQIRHIIQEDTFETSEEFTWLSTSAVQDVLTALEVPVARSQEIFANGGDSLVHTLKYPLVAKLLSPDAVHKSDIGGVILGIQTASELKQAFTKFRTIAQEKKLRFEGMLIQEQITSPIEAFVGISSDPLFGPLVVAGLGGIFVELMQDLSFGVPPLTKFRAEEMLAGLRAKKLLSGFRGQKPGDQEALVKLMMNISAMALAVPEIQELDLNPVKLLPPGSGLVVVDGRIRVKSV